MENHSKIDECGDGKDGERERDDQAFGETHAGFSLIHVPVTNGRLSCTILTFEV
jgi:hypothetical protein